MDGANPVGTEWFTLILQGGSFAVLVYLIVIGVPKWRLEIAAERKAELDVYVADSKEQRKEFTAALASATSTFKAEAVAERLACEHHFATLADAMGKGNDATIQAVRTMLEQVHQHAQRNQQWSAMLAEQVKKTEDAQRQRPT